VLQNKKSLRNAGILPKFCKLSAKTMLRGIIISTNYFCDGIVSGVGLLTTSRLKPVPLVVHFTAEPVLLVLHFTSEAGHATGILSPPYAM
jgi:hypothetical protein